MNVREALLVELVDDTGAAIGSTTVDAAHTSPGQLHRAFSVILMDPDERILLQQRAAVKTRFAGRWANACCGHPGPGQPVTEAAVQRLAEELGSPPVHLTELGVYAYRAADLATGRVEHEFDHVLIGSVATDHPLNPDPAEVSDVRWITRRDLLRALSADPDAFAPWLAGVVALLP